MGSQCFDREILYLARPMGTACRIQACILGKLFSKMNTLQAMHEKETAAGCVQSGVCLGRARNLGSGARLLSGGLAPVTLPAWVSEPEVGQESRD